MPSARLYFLLVFLLALGLRLYFLHDPIFIDEATTYLDFARHPLSQALSDYHLPNNHLLHTLLLHLSLPVFGIEPWALRMPSLLPGLLLIPAVWRLASLWHTPAAAPLAAFFTAISFSLVRYSVESRGYSLQALLVTLLLTDSLLILNSGSTRLRWARWVCWSVLGFYTVPTMLYPFAVIFLWLGSQLPARRPLLLASLATVLLTALLYLPVILHSGLDSIIGNRYVQPMPLLTFLASSVPSYAIHALAIFVTDWPLLLKLTFAALCIYAAFRHPFTRSFLLTALLIVPLLLLLQRFHPPNRIWVPFVPLLMVFAATGASLLLRSPRWQSLLPALFLGTLAWAWPLPNISNRSYSPNSEAFFLWWQANKTPYDILISDPFTLRTVRYYSVLHRSELPVHPHRCQERTNYFLLSSRQTPPPGQPYRFLIAQETDWMPPALLHYRLCLPDPAQPPRLVHRIGPLTISEYFSPLPR